MRYSFNLTPGTYELEGYDIGGDKSRYDISNCKFILEDNGFLHGSFNSYNDSDDTQHCIIWGKWDTDGYMEYCIKYGENWYTCIGYWICGTFNGEYWNSKYKTRKECPYPYFYGSTSLSLIIN